jgi:hypothetical protein
VGRAALRCGLRGLSVAWLRLVPALRRAAARRHGGSVGAGLVLAWCWPGAGAGAPPLTAEAPPAARAPPRPASAGATAAPPAS